MQKHLNSLNYASPKRQPPIRLALAIILTTLATLIATVQWLEIAYRYRLFTHDYHHELYLNHVGNGAFDNYYQLGTLATALACIAIFLSPSRRFKIFALLLTLACLSAPILFYVMHQSHILVEYDEFIRMIGP